MPPAARTGDLTSDGGVITTPPPGAATSVERVLIGGLPAAVVGSMVECVPHVELGPANVIVPNPAGLLGDPVLIGGLPAAKVGDKTACQATIVEGAFNVMIGDLP